ncbi:MAG: hypothetical protein V4858_19165 [Pseudomonadota bacterium]
MLDKIKGVGNQISNLATDAVDGVTSSVKGGAETIVNAAGAAVSAISEKAIRTAVEQMRTVLQVSCEELRQRPVSDQPVTLTASINIGVTALQVQVVVGGSAPPATHGTTQDGVPALLPSAPS